MFDAVNAHIQIRIGVTPKTTTLWVNVNEECQLRIVGVKSLEIDDHRLGGQSWRNITKLAQALVDVFGEVTEEQVRAVALKLN